MTTRLKSLLHAACMILMLVPGIALAQDQKEPAGKAAEQPAQKQAEPTAAAPKPVEAAQPAEPQAAGPEEAPYVIRQGDTLWDISNALMRDPYLWPFIWKANPAITNPDLIYPGNKLSIPSMTPIERALQAPAETQPAERMVEKTEKIEKKEAPSKPAPVEKTAVIEERTPSEMQPSELQGIAASRATRPKPAPVETVDTDLTGGSRLMLPEEQQVPIIDKYSMLNAGFVNQDETQDMIVGSPTEHQSVFSYDQFVYVKVQAPDSVHIGDKYLIFMPLHKVKHPKTGQNFGKLVKVLGLLQITAKDAPEILTARITLSFDHIEKGSMLTPYQEPSLVYASKEKKVKDISGYVLEATDTRTVNSQLNIVYLDKGQVDGVEAGDRFTVYAEHEQKKFPRRKVGEVQVFLVKERSSTAVVRKSSDTIATGDAVDFQK